MFRTLRRAVALLAGSTALLLGGAASASAANLTVTPPDGAKARQPVTVTVTGTADETSLVHLIPEDMSRTSAPACAATYNEESHSPGAAGPDAYSGQVNGNFSTQVQLQGFGPKPGRYRICGYLQADSTQNTVPAGTTTASTTTQPFDVVSPLPLCPTGEIEIIGSPKPDPKSNYTKATVQVRLSADGSVSATVHGEKDEYVDGADGKAGEVVSIELGTTSEAESERVQNGGSVTKRFDIALTPTAPSGGCVLPDGTEAYNLPKGPAKTVTVTLGKGGGSGGGGAALPAGATPSGSDAKIGTLLEAGAYTPTLKFAKPGKYKIIWTAKPKGAKKPVTVAKGSTKVRKAGKSEVRIALTSKGKSLLKNAKSMKLKAIGTFDPAGSAKPKTSTKSFKLKR